jgi:hypothetical protein
MRIFLEPGNPHDFTDGALEELRDSIAHDSPEIDATVSLREEHGYGTTFGEVLRIYVEATEITSGTLGTFGPFVLAIRWAQRRWRKDREDHQRPRPRFVSLYGPDGTILKSVKIDLPSGELEDDTGPQSLYRLPWPPDRTVMMCRPLCRSDSCL